MTKLGMAAIAAPALAIGMVASADYVVVDIQEDGKHIKFPVPVVLARGAVAFAPEEALVLPDPELARMMPAAERMLDALIAAPDGELVRVEERDETVRIDKVGDRLEVRVEGAGEQVHVRVPLLAARDLLQGYDGERFDLGSFLGAVGDADGDLVHVKDGDTEVRISVW